MRHTTLSTFLTCFFAISLAAQWTPITNHNAPGGIGVVWAVDDNKVFAMSGDILLKTNNGGMSWQSQNLHPQPFTYNPEDINFFDAQNGMIVGSVFGVQPLIFSTHDGGQTWITAAISVPDIIQIESVQMVSPSEAYCLGWYGYAFKTTNGGQTWNQIFIPGIGTHWNDIAFTDPMHGKLLDYNGTLHVTDNGGVNWVERYTPVISNAGSMQFFDADHGILNDPGYGFFRTDDGGQTWTVVNDASNGGIGTFYFSNLTTGWAITGGGISKTTDGGATWLLQRNLNDQVYADMHFSGNTGWEVGTDINGAGVMYKAANNGGFGIALSYDSLFICPFQTAHYTCTHDGASSFDWWIDGVSQGVDSPQFQYSPGVDGQHVITCVASGPGQTVTLSADLVAASLPYQPFDVSFTDSICPGYNAAVTIGPLVQGLQYRIQQDTSVLLELNPTQDGYFNWASVQLDTTTTFDFYGYYPLCGWQVLKSVKVTVAPAPKNDASIYLPQHLVCANSPIEVTLSNTQANATYQAFWFNQPWGPVVQGGQGDVTLTVDPLPFSGDFAIRVSTGTNCFLHLPDYPPVEIIPIEASFGLSALNLAIDEPLEITNTSSDSLICFWTFTGASPDIQNSNEQHPSDVSFSAEGTANITLLAISPFGCRDTVQKMVTVYDGAALGTTWAFSQNQHEARTLEVDQAGNVYTYADWYANTINSRIGGAVPAPKTAAVFYKHNKYGVLQWYVTIDDDDGIPAGARLIDQYTNDAGESWLLVSLSQYSGYSVTFSSTDGRVASCNKSGGVAIAHYSPHGVLLSLKTVVTYDPLPDPYPDVLSGISLRRDETGDFFLLAKLSSTNDQLNPVTIIINDENGGLDSIPFPITQGGPDILLKFSVSGEIHWVKNISDEFSAAGYVFLFNPLLLETDHAGGCYVWSKGGPHPPQSSTSLGVQISHFNQFGERDWQHARTIFSGFYSWANDMKVDSRGNVYVLGDAYGCCTFSEFGIGPYFSKISRGGEILWTRSITHYNHGGGEPEERALGLAVDETDKVYVLNSFDYLGDSRVYLYPACVDTLLSGESRLLLSTWDSLGNLIQLIPSNAYINIPYSLGEVSRHLCVRNGAIYANGYTGGEEDAEFLGVSCQSDISSRCFMARVPDPLAYQPYLNACEFTVCEIDSVSKLQVSYLFDQVKWYCNDTLLSGYMQAAINPPKSGVYRAEAVNPLGTLVSSTNTSYVTLTPFPEASIMELDSGLISAYYPDVAYFWYDSIGTLLAVTYDTMPFYPKNPGWYQVETFGVGPCTDISPLYYYDGLVSVAAPVSQKGIQMFLSPNPHTGVFYTRFSAPVEKESILRLSDPSGRILLTQSVPEGSALQELRVEALPPGLYLLQWLVDGRVAEVQKVVRI